MQSIPCVVRRFPEPDRVTLGSRTHASTKTVARALVPADARPGDWVTLYGERGGRLADSTIAGAPEATVAVLWLQTGGANIMLGGGVFPDGTTAHGYRERWGAAACQDGGVLQVEFLALSALGIRDRP